MGNFSRLEKQAKAHGDRDAVRRRANGAITRKEYEQNADNISAMVKLLANEGLKGKEIAERLGISAARVSQLKKN